MQRKEKRRLGRSIYGFRSLAQPNSDHIRVREMRKISNSIMFDGRISTFNISVKRKI